MNVTMKLTLDGLLEALRWREMEREQPVDDGRPPKEFPPVKTDALQDDEVKHAR